MDLNFNHGSGKVHLLSCKSVKPEIGHGRYLTEQFSIESLGYPYDPRDPRPPANQSLVLRMLLGDRAAKCCVVPLLDQLESVEGREMVERLDRAMGRGDG